MDGCKCTYFIKFSTFVLCDFQVDAYIADPETTTTNRLIAQSYKDGLENGSFIQPISFSHFLSDRKDLVLYRNQPWKGEQEENETRTEPHTKL